MRKNIESTDGSIVSRLVYNTPPTSREGAAARAVTAAELAALHGRLMDEADTTSDTDERLALLERALIVGDLLEMDGGAERPRAGARIGKGDFVRSILDGPPGSSVLDD